MLVSSSMSAILRKEVESLKALLEILKVSQKTTRMSMKRFFLVLTIFSEMIPSSTETVTPKSMNKSSMEHP